MDDDGSGRTVEVTRRGALRLVGGGFAAVFGAGAVGGASASPGYRLRVLTFRTPDTTFGTGEEEAALRAYVSQFDDRYGGLRLTFEESGETYRGYDPRLSSAENRERFTSWLASSSAAARDGFVHLLMVSDYSPLWTGTVASSADAGGYVPDGRAAAICNVANKLRGGRTAWQATVMHEVGHALGCRHADGAQYPYLGSRANSPMLLYYGSLFQDAPETCPGDGLDAVRSTEHLSLRLTSCALSSTREHLRTHH
ncbi:hypothetical protein [Halegenticoccus tardaugens]|uniref:hypothetical protein n=1 Tax=Halegenticoccus tardaugens TaxID=2071624 RepID=UPI00100BE7B4|nr:hypothetical protein [Halegenticoccus tardaugens]